MNDTARRRSWCRWLPALCCLSVSVMLGAEPLRRDPPASPVGSAPESQAPIQTPAPAVLKALAADPYWHGLLHMHPTLAGGLESYVDDAAFFLADTGSTDPYQELLATVQAFVDTPSQQCRFVARRQWLASQLGRPAWETALCADYQDWRRQLNTESVVLVFASSYLNSPSSMYGHTFLRFDPPNMQDGSPLLSYALNFGAVVGETDSGMLYALRGIVGSYGGLFSAQRYYEKVKEYSRLDNRDLWEYHLNLSPAEVDRMLAHIWELNLINFRYYFFDENCSYRLLELLDVARPGHSLASQFPVFAIPVDTVRAVDDAGMTSHAVYRASNGTLQTWYNAQLNDEARALSKQLVNNRDALTTPAYLTLPAPQQRLVLEVTYDYLREQQKDQGRNSEIAQSRYAMLRALNQLSADDASPAISAPPTPTPPDRGHRTALVALALGNAEDQGYVDIEARLAYHDLLDNSAGYAADSSLNMGRVVLRIPDGESPQLELAELVEITALAPGNQLQQPLSWQIRGGAERFYTPEDDVLSYHVTGGAGYTTILGGALRGFAMGRARLEYNPLFAHNLDLGAGVALGLLVQGPRMNFFAEAEYLYFAQNEARLAIHLGYQLAVSANAGLRLALGRQLDDSKGINEISISFRQYF